jgi:hypothetical protein
MASVATNQAKRIEPVYLVMGGEMTFDAPRALVWRHVLDYPTWQNYSSVKSISGEAGKEGELVMLIKEEKGFSFPPYFARTIKLDSPNRVIWKTYPEPGQEIDFFGIVEFKVDEFHGKQRLRYDTLYEFQVPHIQPQELDDFRKSQYENFGALMASVFPKLRKAIEDDLALGRTA